MFEHKSDRANVKSAEVSVLLDWKLLLLCFPSIQDSHAPIDLNKLKLSLSQLHSLQTHHMLLMQMLKSPMPKSYCVILGNIFTILEL